MIGQAANGSGICNSGKNELHVPGAESLSDMALSPDLNTLGLNTFIIDRHNRTARVPFTLWLKAPSFNPRQLCAWRERF